MAHSLTVQPGIAPRMLHSRPIVPADLHAAFCGWRTRTPDDDVPGVAWCAGCGLPVARVVDPEVVDLAARLAPFCPALPAGFTQAAPAGVQSPAEA